MKKQITRYIMAIAAGFTIGMTLSSIAEAKTPKQENGLLWRIEGEGIRTSYLYGTFHLINLSDFKMPDKVNNAFGRCEQIVLELDMDDENLQAGMMALATMKDGQTLQKLLSPRDYQQVDSVLNAQAGIGIAAFDRMKPFLVGAMLLPIVMEDQVASYEGTFIQMAKSSEKEILGLETVADQMQIFDDIPYEKQAEDLMAMVNASDSMQILFDEMVQYYRSEDITALYGLFSKSYDDDELRIMVNDRNQKWIGKIQGFSREKSTFFAVGAGHLGGDQGLVQLLRKSGFRVTAVDY